jgi:hypothetical protein
MADGNRRRRLVIPARRFIESPHPIDLTASLRILAVGGGDPALRLGTSEALLTTLTPEGPATLRLTGTGHRLEAEAWGAGAAWALEHSPGLAGAGDDPAGFEPGRHPAVARLHRSLPGLRIIRSGRVFEALLRAVVGQRVTGPQAARSWAGLLQAYGEPAPGPGELLLPPHPSALAGLAYHRLHPLGIERRRAEAILGLARHAARLEECARLPLADAYARLGALPGVGPWSLGRVGLTALGDPDAVPLGDFHLPNTIAWALAGEERADDARMLTLLEPFAGHRGRVVRLIQASGIQAPRFGPRAPARRSLDG